MADDNPSTPEMVERVARAIDPEQWFIDPPSKFREALREYARNKARAAIAAMREPTEAMLAKGVVGTGGDILRGEAAEVWRLMIDAALGE